MKRCSTCNAGYQDDTLSFCLNDGTPLVFATPVETPTAMITETDTVLRVAGARNSNESQVTHVSGIQPTPAPQRKSRVGLTILLTALGMLLLFVLIGVAGVLFYMNTGSPTVSNTNVQVVTPPKPPTVNAMTPNPYSTATPANVATPKTSPTVVPSVPRLPVRANYPPTKRLQFPKGSFTTSTSGEINPGDERHFVLACRSGQTLTATVAGGGGCVTTTSGGAIIRSTTTSGDNRVTVRNTCDTVTKFSLTVSVF